MAQDWFYQIMGTECGPLSSFELKQLAQIGKISPDTLVKKGASGNWVLADKVKGLLSSTTSSDPTASVKVLPISDKSAKSNLHDNDTGHLVRYLSLIAATIIVLILGVILVPELMRDKWELHNADRVSAKLEEADRIQQSDPLSAYKTYDEVLKEAEPHKITDDQFSKKLAIAEKSRAFMLQKVQDKIREEEVEKKRKAEEK